MINKKTRDFVDLHIHSNLSDGTLSPKSIVSRIIKSDIGVFSLTDHDCIDGNNIIKRELEKYDNSDGNIFFIPGLELGSFAEFDGKWYNIHILGYNISDTCLELNSKLEFLRSQRQCRYKKIICKLNELGYKIEISNEYAENKSIGRPEIARKLCELGYVRNVQEAFDLLLAEGKKAYIPYEKLSPKEAIELIKKAGGKAFLAHPAELNNEKLVKFLLKTLNFDGVELWHPSSNEKFIATQLEQTKKTNLFYSGGSDFHGIKDSYPAELGEYKVKGNFVVEFLKYLKIEI